MVKTFIAPAAVAALALGASLSMSPLTVSPAHAGACDENVFSEACKNEMVYNICMAGGGTHDVCKVEKTRQPTLGVASPTRPQRNR